MKSTHPCLHSSPASMAVPCVNGPAGPHVRQGKLDRLAGPASAAGSPVSGSTRRHPSPVLPIESTALASCTSSNSSSSIYKRPERLHADVMIRVQSTTDGYSVLSRPCWTLRAGGSVTGFPCWPPCAGDSEQRTGPVGISVRVGSIPQFFPRVRACSIAGRSADSRGPLNGHTPSRAPLRAGAPRRLAWCLLSAGGLAQRGTHART